MMMTVSSTLDNTELQVTYCLTSAKRSRLFYDVKLIKLVVVAKSIVIENRIASTPSVHVRRLVCRGQEEVYCCPCGVDQATVC